MQYGASYRYALALSAGQPRPLFAYLRLVSVHFVDNEIVCVSCSGRTHNLVERRARFPVADVFGNCSGKEHGFLQNDANL